MQKNDIFQKKTKKKHFLLLLVSDHVVTLNCFTVRDDFCAFPIDFVLRPTTITIRRRGAVRSVLGLSPPPQTQSRVAKRANDKPAL